MKIIMPFIRGPLHGIRFEMAWIPLVNIIVDERDRRIFLYERQGDEMAYYYNHDLSTKLTEHYDEAREKWKGSNNPMVPVNNLPEHL